MKLLKSGVLILALLAVACGPPKEPVDDGPPVVDEVEVEEEEPEEVLTVREVVVPAEAEFIEGVAEEAQVAFREGVLLVYQVPPDYDGAAEKFAESIRLDPAFPEPYYNLGMVLQRQGRPDEAIQVYQEAMEAMPDNEEVRAYIGRVYLARAKLAAEEGDVLEESRLRGEARAQFEAVLAENPDNVAANNGMALYWMMQDDLERAEELVNFVLTIEPDNTVALNTRGLIFLRQERFLVAQWIYEQKVLRIDDDSEEAQQLRESEAASEAWNNLGLSYLAQDMMPEAVRSMQFAVAAKPDNVEARMNLAAIYLSFLDYPRAREQYEAVLRLQDDSLEALIGHSSALFGLGENEEAVLGYRAAYEREPARVDLLERIAKIYETRLGDMEKAIEVYEEYIAAAGLPDDDPLVGKVSVLKMMAEGDMGDGFEPFDDDGFEPFDDDGMEPLDDEL